MSKYFYDDEIICKDLDGVIHLKEGVKRVAFWPSLKSMNETTGESEHFNELRKMQDKIDFVHKIKEDESNYN